MIMDRFRSRADGDVREGAVDNSADVSSGGRSTRSTLKRGDRVLDVENLSVDFGVNKEWVPAAIDLTYHVDAGEVLAIVGESGSGKSASSMALLGLLPSNSRVRGSVRLAGREILGLLELEPEAVSSIQPQDGGKYNVMALTRIDEFNEFFNTELSDADYDTVGGLVMHELGRLPRRGEQLDFAGLRFKVLRGDRRRLHSLEVTRLPVPAAE